jgi:hypothetical protein
MKLFKKRIKVIGITSILMFSNCLYAETASEFECTSEEVSNYLSKEGTVDRKTVTTVDVKKFREAYAAAKKKEAQDKGDVMECLSILASDFDFSKVGEGITDKFASGYKSITAEFVKLEVLSKEVYAELSKGLCSRYAVDSANFIQDELAKELEKSALAALRASSLGKFTDNNLFDSWINTEIDETFSDTKGVLTWRNGLDGDLNTGIVKEADSEWNKKLDDVFKLEL